MSCHSTIFVSYSLMSLTSNDSFSYFLIYLKMYINQIHKVRYWGIKKQVDWNLYLTIQQKLYFGKSIDWKFFWLPFQWFFLINRIQDWNIVMMFQQGRQALRIWCNPRIIPQWQEGSLDNHKVILNCVREDWRLWYCSFYLYRNFQCICLLNQWVGLNCYWACSWG